MKQTITEAYFVDQIVGDKYNDMTYEGAMALFQHLEAIGMDCGEDIEFDKIAIRCEFTEYENLATILNDYSTIKSMDDLHNQTMVIEIEGSKRLIIQQF
jgi:hypothetical protein|tara:strand:- start:83 stop:379 length:297 start_codon:yes stop_codon:yes gene_type:complete